MENKKFILENEYDVNKIMLKIFKIMLIMLPIVAIFKSIGLFILPWTVVVTMSIAIGFLSLIPIIIYKDEKNRNINLIS